MEQQTQESNAAEQAPGTTAPTADAADVTIDELRTQLAARTAAERTAVAAYKALLLKSDPTIPAELIAGDTVEQIEASADAARAIAARIREAALAGVSIDASTQQAPGEAATPPSSAPSGGNAAPIAPAWAKLSPAQRIANGLAQMNGRH